LRIFEFWIFTFDLNNGVPPLVEAASGFPLQVLALPLPPRPARAVGFSLQSLTRAAGIQKHPDEIKHPCVAMIYM
jgi:hypothetical protein